MDIVDEGAEYRVVFYINYGLICLIRKRKIVKFQEQTCTDEQKDQDCGHAAKAKGQGEIKCPGVYPSWPEVENETFIYESEIFLLTIRFQNSGGI